LRNLVVVPAGDRSLHESYAEGRDFDLWVYYYGDSDAIARRYAAGCDRLFRGKGEKFALIRALAALDQEAASPFSAYAFVLLPDDDVRFPGGAADITRAFALAHAIRADIFQPTIANAHYAWEATRQAPGLLCRAATDVETMMPGFSSEVFRSAFLPTLHAARNIRAGWDIIGVATDVAEAALRRPIRIFALDAIAAFHTRPVSLDSPLHRIGHDERLALSLFQPKTMRELARFTGIRAAEQYAFPRRADIEAPSGAEPAMAALRRARVLQQNIRRRRWLRRLLRHMIPEARL
jgi:hypothetical protein